MSVATPLVPQGPVGRLRWTLTDGWTLTRRACAHWVRGPGPLIFSLVFNVLIVLMFAYLFGGAMWLPGADYREFVIPGLFGMTMLFGVGLTTVAVTTDADRGITDRFRSMPPGATAVLLGRAVADMLFSLVVLSVTALAGLAVGWSAHGSAGATAAGFGLILLFRFALVWVGVYLGLILRGQDAVTGIQTLEFPVGFLSAAFVAPGTMPGRLGTAAEWNPLSATVGAARGLFGNPAMEGTSWVAGHSVLMAVIWPLVLLLVFCPLSVRAFRRLSR